MRKPSVVSWLSTFVLLLVGAGVAGAAEKENGKRKGPLDERALERLQNATGGRAKISYSRATGAARFISVDAEGGAGADLMAAGGAEARSKSSARLRSHCRWPSVMAS